MYVQDLLKQHSRDVADKILKKGGHLYVCGDVTMAQNVGDTLEDILGHHGNLSEQEAAEYVLQMKVMEYYRIIILCIGYCRQFAPNVKFFTQ